MITNDHIADAQAAVEKAEAELQATVRRVYPVGATCRFRRSARVLPVTVTVISYSHKTFITVRNEDTKRVYKIDGASPRIRRYERVFAA